MPRATAYCGGRKIPLPLTDAIAVRARQGVSQALQFRTLPCTIHAPGMVGPSIATTLIGRMYDRKTAMNQPTHTTTGHAADAALEQGPRLIYRSRFTRGRPARAYPSTVDADERLRNRRLGAGTLRTYRE